jgi:hypothetical protein
MDILTIVIVTAVIWFMYILRKMNIRYHEHKEMEQAVDKALEMYKKMIIMLKVELKDKVYYCYNNETGDFVCQGKNIKEITKAFKERYPNHGSYILNKYLHLFPGKQVKGPEMKEPTDSDMRKALEQELIEMMKSKNLVK